jgi:quinolinate synthase
MQSSLTPAKEIDRLRKERNAVILAHNYTPGEVQEIADFTGDSLELARRATEVDADVIVFCGVYFMAETAKILNPDKTVLIPDPLAGCPMADMINAEQLRRFKAEHPGAKAVCYVNSTAEVKAECDICVTSGNAERVMRSFSPDEKILFVPDRHLGSHIAALLGREYELWQGCCPIHAKLTAEDIARARESHPEAVVMVHPECSGEVRSAADEALSTGGMCAFVKNSSAREFIVGTETGILHRLRKENPGKLFFPARDDIVCLDMKKITLGKLHLALAENRYEVTLPHEISQKAKRAIENMLRL